MKKKIRSAIALRLKTYLLLLSVPLTGFCQQSKPAPPPPVSYHIVTLDMCDSNKHIYVLIDVIKDGDDSNNEDRENINYFKLRPKWDRQSVYEVNEVQNGYEIELYDQIVEDTNVEFEIEAYNENDSLLFSSSISKKPTTEGIIDVSPHMDKLLGEFTKSNLNLLQFFCGKWVSQVEIIAFLREFYKLTNEEICQLIETYNLLTRLEEQNQISFVWTHELCDNFLNAFGGGTGGNGNNDCNCKLIRTNRSALNIGTGNTDINPGDKCNDYEPDLFAKSYEYDSDEDDLVISTGRMGAAKGATFAMQYNGGENSPDQFTYKMKMGWSEISFRSVCVDPITVKPNLQNCKSCVKDIELQYGLFSHVFLWASKDFHAFGSEIGLRGEDWAAMIVQDGNTTNIEGTAGRTYIIDCEAPDNSIQDVITSAADLLTPINLALDSFSVSNVAAAAVEIIGFVETYISSQGCQEVYEGDTTMLVGTKSYSLEPGEYFKAVLVSGTSFSGKTANNGKGFITINSDSYLAAAVNTNADSTGSVPEYCECEKIGAYVLGSMDGFTPKFINIKHDEGDDPVLDMTTIFDDVPFGIFTLKQIVGGYLGSYGPWAPKWEQEGCCSDVKINCYSECAYLYGCDSYQAGRIGNKNLKLGNEVTVYPNPFDNEITIQKNNNDNSKRIIQVLIFDSNGTLVLKGYENSSASSFSFDTSILASGIYVIGLDIDGVKSFHKLIKI